MIKVKLFVAFTVLLALITGLALLPHHQITQAGGARPNATLNTLLWNPAGNLGMGRARHTVIISPTQQGEMLYVMGGTTSQVNGWQFPNFSQWAVLEGDGTFASLQSSQNSRIELYNHSSTLCDGKIYILGGRDWNAVSQDTIYRAEIASGNITSWTPIITSLRAATYLHTTVELNGRIYVVGGITASGYTNTVYSSATMAGEIVGWETETPLSVTVAAHAAVANPENNDIYVIAGVQGGQAGKRVYLGRADIGSRLITWTTTVSLPLPIGYGGLVYPSAVISNDNIYVIGGELRGAQRREPSNQVFVGTIEPATGNISWSSQTLQFPISTTKAAASVSSSGRVYAVGGMDVSNTHCSSVYYTPLAFLTKSHDPQDEVTYGNPITYTLWYTANTIRDLTNVTISDTFPANTEYVSGSLAHSDPITNCFPDDDRIVCSTDLLPEGSSGHISFQLRVTPLAGSSTSVQAVLPSWFTASRMNAPETAAGRPHRVEAKVICTSQDLALRDVSPRHASTMQPGPILSLAYRNTGSSLVSAASSIPVPVTPATHTTWTQTCTLAHLEVLGKGMSDTLTATLTIPNPDSIVSDSMRIQVALKISSGCKASQIAEVILSTGGSDFRLATPTSVDDFMAVYELDVPVSEAVTVTVVPISDVMTRTDSLIAYVWRTATEGRGTSGWTDNKAVYWDGPRPGYSRTLSLPPLTESGNVTVQVAVADNDPDHNDRVLYLEAEAGGVTATKTITTPSHGSYLDIHSLVLTNVPVGTTDVTVTVASPPNTGDSLGLLGAVAEAACQPTPAVLGVHPDTLCNDVENEITIEGTDFVPTPQVQLGDTELLDVIFVSPNTLTAAVPSGIAQGVYSLTVTNPGVGDLSGTLPNAVTVLHGPITVTDFQPKWGLNTVTTVVTITGSNFRRTLTVSLGSTPLSILWKSDNQLEAIIPPGITPGYYTFTVVNPLPCDREDSTETTFLVVDDSPVIITNVAYLCSDQTGCVPSNPVINTPHQVYLPIVMKSYATP